jgi:hypothetical protein
MTEKNGGNWSPIAYIQSNEEEEVILLLADFGQKKHFKLFNDHFKHFKCNELCCGKSLFV